jgi:hypothetical protein
MITLLLNHQIRSKTFLEDQLSVFNSNRHLSSRGQTATSELMEEDYFVDGLEETGAQLAVDPDRDIYEDLPDVILVHEPDSMLPLRALRLCESILSIEALMAAIRVDKCR